MGREERSDVEWSAVDRGRGRVATAVRPVRPVLSVLGGIGRWLWWFIMIILTPIIVPTYLITMAVMVVLFSPVIIWASRKRPQPEGIIRGMPWFPPELLALWAPPKTYFTRRLFRFATRRW